jgi:hypothetical protein
MSKFKDKFEKDHDIEWNKKYKSDEVDINFLEERYDTSIDTKATAVGKGLGDFPLNYNIKAYPGEKINDKNAVFFAVDTDDIEEIEKDTEEKELHLKEKDTELKNEAIRGNFPFSSDVGFKTDSAKEDIWDAPIYGDGVPTENEVIEEEDEEDEELKESMVQQFGGAADGFVPVASLPPTKKEVEDSTWDPDKEYYITDKNKEESEEAEERKASKEKLDTRKERLKGFGLGGDVPDNIADRKKDNYTYKRSQKRNSALTKPHRDKPAKLAKNKIRESIQNKLKKFDVLNEGPLITPPTFLDMTDIDKVLRAPIRNAEALGECINISENIYKIKDAIDSYEIYYIKKANKVYGGVKTKKVVYGTNLFIQISLVSKWKKYSNLMLQLYKAISRYNLMLVLSDDMLTEKAADRWKAWYKNPKKYGLEIMAFDIFKNKYMPRLTEREIFTSGEICLMFKPFN